MCPCGHGAYCGLWRKMYTEKYEIAGIVIEVNSIYKEVHDYCSEYKSDRKPDFSVIITKKDIDYERSKSVREDVAEGRKIRNFPDSYLEELAVYRKIADKMVDYNTILFHGSVVAVDGQGYMFTAKSGTGKSTHTRLWREYLGEKAVMVNDDKPMIHIEKDKVIVYGTPYNGKHRLGCNIAVPLKSLCILERSENNVINRITKPQAYPTLLQQVYRPDSVGKMKKILTLVDSLTEYTQLYRLRCNMDISAAEMSYNKMKG